ncbi:hypothetical protein HY839_02910 [Candidatus Azambacteria bacterium]|nr:hypothetical protein [Candidatus Azambacteria bacterium]
MMVKVPQATAVGAYIFIAWFFLCFLFFAASAYFRHRMRAKEMKRKRGVMKSFTQAQILALQRHDNALRRLAAWSCANKGVNPASSPAAKKMMEECANAFRALMSDKDLEKK